MWWCKHQVLQHQLRLHRLAPAVRTAPCGDAGGYCILGGWWREFLFPLNASSNSWYRWHHLIVVFLDSFPPRISVFLPKKKRKEGWIVLDLDLDLEFFWKRDVRNDSSHSKKTVVSENWHNARRKRVNELMRIHLYDGAGFVLVKNYLKIKSKLLNHFSILHSYSCPSLQHFVVPHPAGRTRVGGLALRGGAWTFFLKQSANMTVIGLLNFLLDGSSSRWVALRVALKPQSHYVWKPASWFHLSGSTSSNDLVII